MAATHARKVIASTTIALTYPTYIVQSIHTHTLNTSSHFSVTSGSYFACSWRRLLTEHITTNQLTPIK